MSEIGMTPEIPIQTPKMERNLTQEYMKASEIGRDIFVTARERSMNRYTTKLLDINKMPRDLLAACGNKENVLEDDVRLAKEASIKLMVEAAAQIVESRNEGMGVVEDDKSLLRVKMLLDKGKGFIGGVIKEDPKILTEAGRLAYAKRHFGKCELPDEGVVRWVKECYGNAENRIVKSMVIIKNYHGR